MKISRNELSKVLGLNNKITGVAVFLILMSFGCGTIRPGPIPSGTVKLADGGSFTWYKEGPVTVHIGDIKHLCFAYSSNPHAVGCLVKITQSGITTYSIFCPDGPLLAQCLAHEIRHIVEPEWRH